MKTSFAALLCVIFVSVAQTFTKDEQIEMGEECRRQTGMSEDELMGWLIGVMPDNEITKAHTLCVTKKFLVMDNDGGIIKDKLKLELSVWIKNEAILDEAVEKCYYQRSTPEKTAFESRKCAFDVFSSHNYVLTM